MLRCDNFCLIRQCYGNFSKLFHKVKYLVFYFESDKCCLFKINMKINVIKFYW